MNNALTPPSAHTGSAGTLIATSTAMPSAMPTSATTTDTITRPFRSSSFHMKRWLTGLLSELGASTEPVFRTRLTWMLALGPLAVVADFSGLASQTLCFCLAGLALIPCAERCVVTSCAE